MECRRLITGAHGVLVPQVLNIMVEYRDYVGVDASISDLMHTQKSIRSAGWMRHGSKEWSSRCSAGMSRSRVAFAVSPGCLRRSIGRQSKTLALWVGRCRGMAYSCAGPFFRCVPRDPSCYSRLQLPD